MLSLTTYGGEEKHMTFKVSLKQSKQPCPNPLKYMQVLLRFYTDSMI